MTVLNLSTSPFAFDTRWWLECAEYPVLNSINGSLLKCRKLSDLIKVFFDSQKWSPLLLNCRWPPWWSHSWLETKFGQSQQECVCSLLMFPSRDQVNLCAIWKGLSPLSILRKKPTFFLCFPLESMQVTRLFITFAIILCRLSME